MIFAIIIILVAIAYSYSQREEPIRIAYAGGTALAAGAISFIIFLSIISNIGPVGQSGEQAVMLQTLLAALVLIPTGIIITIIGLVLNHRQSSKGESD